MRKFLYIPALLFTLIMAFSLVGCSSGNPSDTNPPAGHVNAQTWDTLVLQSPDPVLVYFYRDNCPWCIQQGPIVEQLQTRYDLDFTILKGDISNGSGSGLHNIPIYHEGHPAPNWWLMWNDESDWNTPLVASNLPVPAFILFIDGEITFRHYGAIGITWDNGFVVAPNAGQLLVDLIQANF
ncbi:MAG: thioredoxin family protein [Firmicutes bacterium]|nr:thioredoxin family protein [Bacillota bacterium]